MPSRSSSFLRTLSLTFEMLVWGSDLHLIMSLSMSLSSLSAPCFLISNPTCSLLEFHYDQTVKHSHWRVISYLKILGRCVNSICLISLGCECVDRSYESSVNYLVNCELRRMHPNTRIWNTVHIDLSFNTYLSRLTSDSCSTTKRKNDHLGP